MIRFDAECWVCDVQASICAGGKSSSSSSNTNQTTNAQYDQRVAAADQGVALGPGASFFFQGVDAGALDTAKELIANGLEVVDSTTGKALSIVADNSNKFIDALRADQSAVLGFLDKRSQSEQSALAEQAMKIVLPAVLGYALIKGMTK